VDLIRTCQEAIKLYPNSKHFETRLHDGFDILNQLESGLKALGLPWKQRKEQLLYGKLPAKVYPWMTDEFKNTRSQSLISEANRQLKIASDCLEIRPSPIRNTLSEQSNVCYGVFATQDIKPGQNILAAAQPYGFSLEQGSTQCNNCLKSLFLNYNDVTTFPCCPETKYCSSICQKIAADYYHATTCGRNFSSLIERAQNCWGGRTEAPILTTLMDLPDKVRQGYPTADPYLYPDQVPLFLTRIFAVCLKQGIHPLKQENVRLLMAGGDKENCTIGWSMSSMVIDPLRSLEILGVDIYADEQWDTWVWLTMWYVPFVSPIPPLYFSGSPI